MTSKKEDNPYKIKRNTVIIISLVILAIFYFISSTPLAALFSLKDSSLLLIIFSTIFLIIAFYLFDHLLNLKFNPKHYVFVIIIVITGVTLSPLYFIYPQYDKALHFFQPILLSSILFHLLQPIKMKRKWKLIFTFFIVIGLLGLFEIGEYLLDNFLGWKLQGVYAYASENFELIQSRIDDTMFDLILGITGAIIYMISIYITKNEKE